MLAKKNVTFGIPNKDFQEAVTTLDLEYIDVWDCEPAIFCWNIEFVATGGITP